MGKFIMDTLTLYWNLGINFIPWWVWGIIVIVALLFTWQIWGTIWLALPLWAKVAVVFIFAAVLAYFAGRNTGSKNERDLQRKKDAEGEALRTRIDQSIKNLDDAALEKRASRWYRD